MTVTLIAAASRNGVIGRDGGMPWHLPEDLTFFKRTTMGHPMVMGRKTFESTGLLPGRRSIVITRDPAWSAPGAERAESLDHALALVGDHDLFITGGGEIYRQSLPFADRVLLTEIDREVDGDVTFPDLDPEQWRETDREQRDGFAFVRYERHPPRTTVERGERLGRGAERKLGASVAIRDHEGRLLLTRRQDNALWCLPGGGVDPGERWDETAVREAREETGLEVRATAVLAAYSDPDLVVCYPDGQRAQVYGVCFRAEVVGGELGLSDETTQVGWFTRDEATRLPLTAMHVRLVAAAFDDAPATWLPGGPGSH